jgi:broad specificity phosphatase PhoE
MEKNLYFIRHGESEHNAKHSLSESEKSKMKEIDFVNTCLSLKGKEQAKQIQGSLDLVIVSPLRRTLETYIHSGLRVKRLLTSDLFREWMIYGPSGQFECEEDKNESNEQINTRIKNAIEFIKLQPESNIGIISHGVFLCKLAEQLGNSIPSGMYNAQVIHLKIKF